jgi:hypothetical protein
MFELGNFDVMLKHIKPEKLDDFFIPLSGRREKGAYFCRIAGYSPAIERFIKAYYDVARRAGVIIDGKIPNPDSHSGHDHGNRPYPL